MSDAATNSATFSNEIVTDFEDVLVKLKLLTTQLARASSSSTKPTHNDALKLDARESQLRALEFTLQADRAEFEAKRKIWDATKGGGSSKISDREVKAVKAKLDEERLQLEDEKNQLRFAQMQQKVAQSRLEDAVLKFEAAQGLLEEARTELETAREHLEAAESQRGVNNMRLEAAKASLEASKMICEAATNDLNDAKSKFEDAKTQLEVATASIISSRIEEENSELLIQVCQLKSKIDVLESSESKLKGEVKKYKAKSERLETENSNLRVVNADELKESRVELEKVKDDIKTLEAKISKLEDQKLISQGALEECKAEKQLLDKEKSELKNDKERLDNELKESRTEPEGVKKQNISLKAKYEKHETFEGVRIGNPVVFFDMKVRGAPVGRIVLELYADINPRLAEIFRALCVGEKLLPGTNRQVGYKGTDITSIYEGVQICGGNVRVKNRIEFDSIFGDISDEEKANRYATGPGDLHICILYNDQPNNMTYSFFINGSGGPKIERNYPLIGRVIQGLDVVDAKRQGIGMGWIEKGTFVIDNCGQLA